MDLFVENLKFLAVCIVLFVFGVIFIYGLARLIGYAIARSWYETREEQWEYKPPNKQEENNGQEKK